MLKATHVIMRKILDEQMPVRGVSVHLFQNNHVPSRNSTLLDLVEATFDGYVALTPVWAPSFQNGVEDVAAAPKLTFEAGAGLSGPQDIYGYYVLDVDGDLAWAEAFDGGLTTISVVGQQIDVFPQFKIKNYGE